MSVLLYGLQSLPDSVSMMYKAAPLCGLKQKRGGKNGCLAYSKAGRASGEQLIAYRPQHQTSFRFNISFPKPFCPAGLFIHLTNHFSAVCHF